MAQGLFSQHWYKVADLRPRLRGQVEVHHQTYRGITWHILEDRQSNRFHRLSDAAWFAVAMMNGQRPLREVWNLTEARFGAEVPSQDDLITLLGQLHSADLLVAPNLPDLEELSRRSGRQARRELMGRVKNPLALRLPLFDPDRVLGVLMPCVAWLFSPFGALLWLALVGTGIGVSLVNWDVLSGGFGDRVINAQNLLLMLMVYPVMKALHELGHAFAVKRWGGEVHEIGVMFLILLPVPYVDASASLGFRDWWQRAVVGAAGILVELSLAAGAVILWTVVEPGLVRAILFNIALIGGVSTLLFNGNPLLRFDGYYVLSDLIGIPNLGTRANAYIGYLIKRYGFGVKEANSPLAHPSERLWLVGYGVAAFLYRIFLVISIALFVAGQFFFVGVLLAVLAVVNMALWPSAKALWQILAGPSLARKRGRAIAVTAGCLIVLSAIALLVPLPRATVAQGVVTLPSGAEIRSGTGGSVAEILSNPGAKVRAGTPLIRIENAWLGSEIDVQNAFLSELDARYAIAFVEDSGEAALLEAEIARAEDELARLQEQVAQLIVRAPRDGRWEIQSAQDLPGRIVSRGDLFGHVVDSGEGQLRAVVSQERADLVRGDTVTVELRFATAPDQSLPARLDGEVPEAGQQLPSFALGRPYGGAIPLDTTAATDAGPVALSPVFQFDLALQTTSNGSGTEISEHSLDLYPGARFFVRFEHSSAPMAQRLYRGIRQLFLSQFDV